MDFSLESLSDAFRHNSYRLKHESFMAYAFVLATSADCRIFPELLSHFGELHRLTGNRILVVAPQADMRKAPGVPMTAFEISNVLSSKRFYNHWSQEWVDVTQEVDRFIQKQTEQTYDFADFIALPANDLPCVVFFETLLSPERYVRWSLRGASASDVIIDFRAIIAAIQSADNQDREPRVIDIIAGLDRKRMAVKVFKELGKAIPVLTNLLP